MYYNADWKREEVGAEKCHNPLVISQLAPYGYAAAFYSFLHIVCFTSKHTKQVFSAKVNHQNENTPNGPIG